MVKALGGDVAGKTIGVLGLTFKPNTDDMRDAPSLDIIPALQAMGAKVQAFDPEGMHEAEQDADRRRLQRRSLRRGRGRRRHGDHHRVGPVPGPRLRPPAHRHERSPVLVDLRNVYSREDMRARGFSYTSVGR